MTSLTPPDPNSTRSAPNVATIQQLRNWFDDRLVKDFRQLEQTRKSTIKTAIVATSIFILILGGILVGGWKLEEATSSIKTEELTPIKVSTTGLCTEDMPTSQCELLTSTSQAANLYSEYSQASRGIPISTPFSFGFREITIVIAAILGWLFLAFITSVTDNYRVGWRSQIVRQVIDFIDLDKNFTYIGQAEPQAVRESLLHSGMATKDRQELIYINLDDSIAVKWGNIRISWSDLQATIPTDSFLSVMDSFFQAIHEKFSLNKILQINFFSIFIKVIRAIIYLFKALVTRQLDFDDFNREVIGNDAGRKTIFKGIFCQILLPEVNELGQLIVVPKLAKDRPNGLKIPPHLEQNVKTIDPEFDRIFTTYSNDRTTHLQVLSAAVRRYSIDYYRTSRCPIYLSANDQMVYIGISTKSPFLEPKLGQNMLSFAPIRDYYNAVKSILDIAAAL